MGSGKSTVGRALADKLNMKFIDTDSYIEKREGMTISKIFEKYGEEYFRNAEYEVCRELSASKGYIISTGGGTLLREKNVAEIKKNGTVFFLDTSVSTILERLKFDTTRPLLQRPDKEQAVNELLFQRMPLYKKAADHIVDGDGSPRKICADIIRICNGEKHG